MLAVLAAVMVLIALLPARPRSATDPALRVSPVDWEAVRDDPRRTLVISWMGIPAYPEARAGSWIQQRLEEHFNVRLRPIFLDWNAYAQRRPLLFCAGEVPDVIWDGDPIGVRNNLRHGFIMEIPHEVILRHAPTYVRLLNRCGKEGWLYSQYRGRNYGVPTFFEGAIRPRISCWRMDWLRRVGITRVPETLAEMHEALRRLRYDDPDGNGRQDTYGWSPNISHWSVMFAEVFAAHDILPFDLMLRDGRVVWGGIQPEARQALALLRQWYAEGLLDPDFVLDSRQNSGQAKFLAGRLGYLYQVNEFDSYDLHNPASLYSRLRAFDPQAELAPAPPLRNAAGVRRGRTWGSAGHVLQFGRHLEGEPEKVVRVLSMLEAITCDETLYLEAQWGRRGRHWEYTPERGRYLLPPLDADKRLRAEELLDGNIFFYPCTLDFTYLGRYQMRAAVEFRDTYRRPEWSMQNVLGKSDVVPAAERYLEDLRRWQTTFYVEVVTGRRELEEFTAFVAAWRSRGGDLLLAEANAMYAELQAIWRRLGVTPEGAP